MQDKNYDRRLRGYKENTNAPPTIRAIYRSKVQSGFSVRSIAGRKNTVMNTVKEVGVFAKAFEIRPAVGIRWAVHVVCLFKHVFDAYLLWVFWLCHQQRKLLEERPLFYAPGDADDDGSDRIG